MCSLLQTGFWTQSIKTITKSTTCKCSRLRFYLNCSLFSHQLPLSDRWLDLVLLISAAQKDTTTLPNLTAEVGSCVVLMLCVALLVKRRRIMSHQATEVWLNVLCVSPSVSCLFWPVCLCAPQFFLLMFQLCVGLHPVSHQLHSTPLKTTTLLSWS